MTMHTVHGVRSVALANGTLVATTEDALLRVTLNRAEPFAPQPSSFVVAPDGSVLFAHAGSVKEAGGVEWPALDARIRVLARALDGRIAIGTDDQRVFVGSADGRWLADLALPRVPEGIHDLAEPTARGVGFLHDGSLVVIAGTGDTQTFDLDGRERHRCSIEDLAYEDTVHVHALGGERWMACSDRLAVVVDAGRVVHRYAFRAFAQGAFLHDGRIAILGNDGAIEQTFVAPTGARSLARFDGLLGVGRSDGTVLWLDEAGAEIERAWVRPSAVIALAAGDGVTAFLHADETLVVISDEHRWQRPRVPKGLAPIRKLALGPLYDGAWSEDGTRIAVRGREDLRVHDAHGRELARFEGGSPMEIFSAHGTFLAYFRERIDVVDASTFARIGGGPVPPANLSMYAVLPTGTLLASTQEMIFVSSHGALRSIDTGARVKNGLLHHYGCYGEVSRDGTRAAIAPTDRAGILLSLPDGRWIAELPPQNGRWAFSPDGSHVLESRSGTVYRASDGAELGCCGLGEGHTAWSPHGDAIVRCDADGAWWCDRDGRRIYPLEGVRGGTPSFAPGASHLVIASGRELACFEAAGVPLENVTLATPHEPLLRFIDESRLLAWPSTTDPLDPTAFLVDVATSKVKALPLVGDGGLHWDTPIVMGDRIVLAPMHGPIHVFRAHDGTLEGLVELPENEPLRSVSASLRGELLIATESGHALVLA